MRGDDSVVGLGSVFSFVGMTARWGLACGASTTTAAAHGRDPWAGWGTTEAAALAVSGPRIRSAGSVGG